ncbi:glycosyl hydrolase family 18 protein [Terrilactibacillus sp. S3-3]|nr:glycosyl hydrolase family 18 protein [Terrilactibacillus sp. S3-3]
MSSTVPPKMDDTLPWLRGYDYRGIGAVVDELFVMAYDFHHAGNEPGASAPIENVRKTIAYAAGLVDHSKIILGIPFYGYDWVIPYNPRNPGKAITNPDAVNLAMRHQAPIHFSEADQSVYFNYTDENGQNHVVWFSDTRSLFAEVDIVRSTGIGGIGGWQLNFAMPQWPWVYTRYFQTRKA